MGIEPTSKGHVRGGAVTWNRDISRIFIARCGSCHHEGGSAFSLVTFKDALVHAASIKDEVLSRRMPPWGAVKGFGDFRNEQALTPEELELITAWFEGDLPRGNPKDLPALPRFDKPSGFTVAGDRIVVSGSLTLKAATALEGLFPEKTPRGVSFQVVAVRPDGGVVPLVWLYEYDERYRHLFLFRKPVELPAGTVIRGVPLKAKIVLIPAKTLTR